MLLGGLAGWPCSGFCPDLSGTRRIARFEDDAGGEGFARIGAGRWFPYGCDPAIGYSVDSDGRWAAGRAEQDEEYLLSVRNLVGVDLESRSGSGNGAWTGPGMPGPGASASCWVRGSISTVRRSAGVTLSITARIRCWLRAIACGYIEGMQQNGVIATIKHFAANNQEYRRHATNSVVDERTLRELYFPVFKDAVQKAGVGAVMTSYNPLNGIHSAENRWLITDVLRKEWGFDGIVMSDWTSTYTTLGCMESGLDLEMPKGYWLNYKSTRTPGRGIVT